MKTIADSIHDLREERGWTRKELAEKSGIAVQTIRHYESGAVTPGLYNFHDLAKALGVSMEKLIGEGD